MAFRERTTFVIGAGASAEFGLPVGTGLATEIKKTCTIQRGSGSENEEFLARFINANFSKTDRAEAIDTLFSIRDGIHTAVSIDAFIHRNRHNPVLNRLGKILISLEILKAERESTLASGQWSEFQNNPGHTIGSRYGRLGSPDYTWIGNFVRILFDGINESEIAQEIDIICFNYDRCIEVYLAESISAAFGISLTDALAIIEDRINIIHPYGYLGPVAKDSQFLDEKSIGYGYSIDRTFDIERIANNIRTYTERIDEVSVIKRIHAAMNCNVLVFLGFGFNNQNMNLLRLRGNTTGAEPKQIYVSGYGFERQVESTLIRRIGDLWSDGTRDHERWSKKIHIEFGETARRLFEIHHPNLSSFSVGYVDEVTGDLIMDRKRD